jgi:hypothetical protein
MLQPAEWIHRKSRSGVKSFLMEDTIRNCWSVMKREGEGETERERERMP